MLEALVQRSSRQEVSRILQSIDSGLGACEGSSFQAEGLGHWVAQECGYEDIGELEDALGCQFDLFLESLPHVSVTSDDTGTKRAARRRKGQGKSRKFSLTVKDRRDLDRSVLRGPRSRVVLPELEVEFSADGERKVDTIRGAISHAAFELSISAQGAEGERREKIWQASEQVPLPLQLPPLARKGRRETATEQAFWLVRIGFFCF